MTINKAVATAKKLECPGCKTNKKLLFKTGKLNARMTTSKAVATAKKATRRN
jgi:hypothetical protein